ncbi:alpha/beta hydrolase [Mariniblastus fucicola]|uniref:Acetylxylan esterase n=1 Tax=Mariniblastus fucicola TaxID=980251 RepID=A0A5B9PHB0_9BACT|nr:alpha/beta hydrolase [Mariniblastus fucicola]QEG24102.1 Acetylxylan esterase precursor [Mariniblastus fucicola]
MNALTKLGLSREFTILVFLLVLVGGGWLVWNQPMKAKAVEPAEHAEVLKVWPDSATDKRLDVGQEHDTTKDDGELIAGKRVQRITNVSSAELHFWPADADVNTGTSVIICPGGGFYILAWDLEGTEIAQWLNSIGVNAFILKYRVPTARESDPAAAPTEDLQRAIAMVRHNAEKWNLAKDRVGTLGFSAGGNVIANAAFTTARYDAIDDVDKQSARANFIVPVYGARMVKKEGGLRDGMELNKDSPRAFIVHAFDDFVPVQNALELARLYKEADVPVDCHVFDTGGHGFGARFIEDVPVTNWPKLCESWMRKNGWLERIGAADSQQ